MGLVIIVPPAQRFLVSPEKFRNLESIHVSINETDVKSSVVPSGCRVLFESKPFCHGWVPLRNRKRNFEPKRWLY